jgi:hypothetical protein
MKVDMSPQAVKSRLKLVSQLWRLSLSLGKAKKESDTRRNVENLPENNIKEKVV